MEKEMDSKVIQHRFKIAFIASMNVLPQNMKDAMRGAVILLFKNPYISPEATMLCKS